MSAFVDLSGQKFHRMTILSRHSAVTVKHGTRLLWLCRCDCGNEVIRRADQLKQGRIKSCGCLNAEVRKATAVARGKLQANPPGVTGFNLVINSIRKNANQRGISFNLTRDQIRELTGSNCFYCGIAPCQSMHSSVRQNDYIYNGIDRVDNSRGYDFDNCVSCCGSCNSAKKNISLEMVKKIYEYACEHKMF